MARSGIRAVSPMTGRLIATVAGPGLRRGAGPGSTRRRGDLPPSITAAG